MQNAILVLLTIFSMSAVASDTSSGPYTMKQYDYQGKKPIVLLLQGVAATELFKSLLGSKVDFYPAQEIVDRIPENEEVQVTRRGKKVSCNAKAKKRAG